MYELSSLYDKNESTQALTSAVGVFTHTPAMPIEIVSFGFIITTVLTGVQAFAAAIVKNLTAGSTVSQTTLGTLTLTNAQALLLTAGKVMRSRIYDSGATEGSVVVVPGQQAVINVTTQMSGGNGIPFIEYKQLPRFDLTTIETIVAA